ncbi:MAG: 50S ribosomal protein L20 [Patescibacteria group bacterium]
MPRVKRGINRIKKRKKLLSKAKGYTNRRKNVTRLAKEATTKAGAYAYRDRRNKKRVMRRLWQTQLNNAARMHGMKYSELIHVMKKKSIELDRKVLSQIAKQYPEVFKKFIESLKA